ncbi:MATE family efflux transporter [Murimonas intestini]|uniref:MATE family efflux protein n=1 Tax=Murimonas intestini TaxID=1337051 RepID=A0AB73T2Y0_9FIRM|nr:MATE family efflux transporter [Murimonas intestini]MCR1884015.1 MATE family efflux transporter [Murimonas intestini]
MKERLFSDKVFYRKLLQLTVPIALQNLMLASVAAADAIMLGSVAQNAMSAVSLATQIQFIQNMVLTSVVSTAIILGAQYWGRRDTGTISDIFCTSLRYCGVASILFFIGCIFFPRYLMLIFTNNEAELIETGIHYLKVAGWSYLLTGISQCYLAVMKISGHAAQAARVSIVTVILNIVLNAVFIFGLFGLPAMGVQGAALATLLARIVELVWCMRCSFRKGYIRPDLRRLFRRNKLLAADFWKCLYPLLGASLFWGVGFTSYSAFMGHLGTDATAANSVAAVVRDLICCLCNGLGSGGGILVGNELGAGNLKRGKKYGDRLLKLAILCGAVSTLVMLTVTPVVLNFVRFTEGARKYLIGMMVIMAVYMIGRAINTIVINGIFASGGDTMFDLYSLAVTMWGIAVPLAAAGTFLFDWPVLVVYACTCLDEVGKIPWVLAHYRKYKWVRDLTRDMN